MSYDTTLTTIMVLTLKVFVTDLKLVFMRDFIWAHVTFNTFILYIAKWNHENQKKADIMQFILNDRHAYIQ